MTQDSSLKQRVAFALDKVGMLAVLLVLYITFSFTVDGFFTIKNFGQMHWSKIPPLALSPAPCSSAWPRATPSLSVGTLVPCAGAVTAIAVQKFGFMGPYPAMALGILCGMVFGAGVGFVNGVVVAKAKINPLITTLATMQILKTLTYVIAGGVPVSITNDPFNAMARLSFPDIRTADGILIFQMTFPVWFCLACFLLFGFLMARTTFGRNTLAVGGNEEAARLAGIHVDRVKIAIFVLQGLVTAGAGILIASRLSSAQLDVEQGLELRVIAACVLGGVSLTGGIGGMSHVIAGVFIMGVVEKAMGLKDIPPFWRQGVSGAILLAAVTSTTCTSSNA